MGDSDRERIAKFVEAAHDGSWSRQEIRNAIFHFKLREHRDAIFLALGFDLVGWTAEENLPENQNKKDSDRSHLVTRSAKHNHLRQFEPADSD